MGQGFSSTMGSSVDVKQRLIASNVVFLFRHEFSPDVERGPAVWRFKYCLRGGRRHDINVGGHSLPSKREQCAHCC
jgi:hypothetical protein